MPRKLEYKKKKGKKKGRLKDYQGENYSQALETREKNGIKPKEGE